MCQLQQEVKKYISKEFKLRTTANYKFECEYVTAGDPALTVRFADPVATSNKDIFKVWIKDGVSLKIWFLTIM